MLKCEYPLGETRAVALVVHKSLSDKDTTLYSLSVTIGLQLKKSQYLFQANGAFAINYGQVHSSLARPTLFRPCSYLIPKPTSVLIFHLYSIRHSDTGVLGCRFCLLNSVDIPEMVKCYLIRFTVK